MIVYIERLPRSAWKQLVLVGNMLGLGWASRDLVSLTFPDPLSSPPPCSPAHLLCSPRVKKCGMGLDARAVRRQVGKVRMLAVAKSGPNPSSSSRSLVARYLVATDG